MSFTMVKSNRRDIRTPEALSQCGDLAPVKNIDSAGNVGAASRFPSYTGLFSLTDAFSVSPFLKTGSVL